MFWLTSRKTEAGISARRGICSARSAPEQTLDQLLPCEVEVLGNVTKDTGQSAHAERGVARHGDVVLTALRGGKAKVAPGLTGQAVAQGAKHLREIVPRDVSREPQEVMTSSRTKCSRMIRGAWPGSK